VPPSVRTVTDLPGLGLRIVAGPDGRQRPVRWVAVSELEDPTPFLEGGELLLSTGMRLPAKDSQALAEYVQRLVRAGVAAFGLGVGLTHATVPEALAAAAGAGGLPLIEVPSRTAFIAISKAVSALLGAEEYEGITRGFEAQRDLTRAALAPDGAAVVAARLARHVEGWVLVLDSAGTPLHVVTSPAAASPADLAGWPVAHRADLADLRRRGLLASSALADANEVVGLHPLGVRGRVRGFLAVGTTGALDRNRQSVVAVAVSLLSIAMEADEPGVLGGRDVRVATVRLLFAGAAASELPLALLGWEWLTEAALRVLVVHGTAAQRAEVTHRLEGDTPRPGLLVVDTGTEVVAVVQDGPGTFDRAWPELAQLPAGGSSTLTLAELARGRTQARQALAGAHGPGVHWFGQLAAEGMLGALDPQAATGVADVLLAPLEGRKGDLLASLAAWLARHGQWDTAAADLGVHRHTLRYRMRRVEELLGRSLDDADLRAELWLALRVRGAGPGR
jgi:PucR family transcriptional regulator, purine catabolism regulatory protein